MKKQREWIHYQVLTEPSTNLLNYQKKILSNLTDDNNLRIVGITKNISKSNIFSNY